MMRLIEKFAALLRGATLRALAWFYAVAVILVVAVQVVPGTVDAICYATGALRTVDATLNDFIPVGAELVDNMTLVNATNDTQLLYDDGGREIRNLYVDCEFSSDPGEFVLFYQENMNAEFGTNKMLYAKVENGIYVFELPRGVKKIRLDTGVEPSVTVTFSSILINRASFNDCMRFNTTAAVWLLILPGILYGLLALQVELWDDKLKRAEATAGKGESQDEKKE